MWETLLPVVVGGVLATSGGWLSQWWEAKRARRALAGAFAGEIGALCAIARRRRYLEEAEALLVHLRKTGQLVRVRLPIEHQYMIVLDANADRIGYLPATLAFDVAVFYTQVKSLLEDVRMNSPEPPSVDYADRMLTEQIRLLAETLSMGDELVKKLRAVCKADHAPA